MRISIGFVMKFIQHQIHIFIAVTLFMPQGVVGLVKKMRARKGDVA